MARLKNRTVLCVAAALSSVAGVAGLMSLGASGAPSPDPGPTIATVLASAERVFPVLSTTRSGLASDNLPTRAPRTEAVATGRTEDPIPVTLTLTDSAELCAEWQGTSTCLPALDAVTSGVFVAAVDCADGQVDATVTGVLPSGATSVSGGGQTAEPESDGAVSLHIVDQPVTGLRLSNGGVSPWSIPADFCEPTGDAGGQVLPTKPIEPVD